ncbi:MAG: DUF2330 domain-containing protein [Proteobacteria bacterium]|nr:DUF2330 domain-containing protein [Pseudomonadota bacterium]
MKRLGIIGAASLTLGVLAASGQTADAFCGFYVSGTGGKLFNDATQVVLMRQGTRTVLSMQNDFKGPLEDFAMVVPVPVVLHDTDVKTLPKAVFDHVDSLGSPRLVEYWEQDPCPAPVEPGRRYGMKMPMPMKSSARGGDRDEMKKETVKVEAKFDVAEYQIVILSATEATGLETWLNANHYKIPAGAEPLLRPYVESGQKFFVARVDPKKVTMVDGHAALSPIRFHYDSEDFALPIRLGMANSAGKQDLIVNIISGDKRYEVANYRNVFIPTNFDVTGTVKARFGEFYASLFDKTIEANPKSVVTEYAWTAKPRYHCDPCPDLDVSQADLMTLGGDIVGGQVAQGTFVLTRLHARYGKADMQDDLRFREAKPMPGGREVRGKDGLEYGAVASTENYFQARYAVRHWWTGAIACKNPQRGVWGGPPDDYEGDTGTIAASKVAFAPRNFPLGNHIGRDLWEIGFKKIRATSPKPTPTTPTTPPPPKPSPKAPAKAGTPIKAMGLGLLGGASALLAGLVVARRRKPR